MSTISLVLAGLVVASTAHPPRGTAEAARATARGYLEAIMRGDADAALALVADPSEADRVLVRASAASEKGLQRVEELAKSRFGERGDLGIAARHRRLLGEIERAPVELKGDRAVVRPKRERPVRMRRVDGAWKIESPAEQLTGEERRAFEKGLQKSEEAAKELGERIRSGAVKGAQEAREWLRKALGRTEKEDVQL